MINIETSNSFRTESERKESSSEKVPITPTTVDIIIVSFNTQEYLKKCLGALIDGKSLVSKRIIVVDNASTDSSADMVENFFSMVTLVRNPQNRGFAAAVNQAVSLSNSTYILLLNPDVVCTPLTVDILTNFMNIHTEVAAVGPLIVNERERMQESAFVRPPSLSTTIVNFLSMERLIKRLWPDFPGKYSISIREARTSREVCHLLGACLLLRRKAFEEAGGFDESFFVFREETDLCLRLQKLRWKIRYYPEVSVIHHGAMSVKKIGLLGKLTAVQSDITFFRKYGGNGKLVAILGIRILEEFIKFLPWILGLLVPPFRKLSFKKLVNHQEWLKSLFIGLSASLSSSKVQILEKLKERKKPFGEINSYRTDKIRVGIDASYLNRGSVGIGIYVRELLNAINLFNDEEIEIRCIQHHKDRKYRGWLSKTCKFIDEIMWYTKCLPEKANKMQLDLVHMPANLISIGTKCPQVVTIHDVNYRHSPAFSFPRRSFYKLIIPLGMRKAVKIITDSNSIAEEISNLYGIERKKIIVIPLGIRLSNYRFTHKFKWESLRPYILFVGRLDPLKNIPRLVEAFYKVYQDEKYHALSLIIAGEKGRDAKNVRKTVKRLHLENRVHVLGNVGDDELAELYKHAELFVCPSLSEGFGFPPLEANAVGIPVIASSISCLHENLGSAAYFFSPKDTNSIAEAIEIVLKDKNLRDRLVKLGKENALRFSWKRTAEETLRVYQDISRQMN